jgi:hypothetical protein
VTEPRVYKVVWYPADPLRCTILVVTGNRFVIRAKKETPEERLERKAIEAASTPFENLKRLMQGHFESKWKATELYHWFEEHAPGYQARAGSNEAVEMRFAHMDHLLLFKLTWT